MPRTWGDLRTEILGMLDAGLGASAASDTRRLVDLKLERMRDRLYGLRPPPTIKGIVSPDVIITSQLKYIGLADANDAPPITPSLQLTSAGFWRVYTLRVEDEDWRYADFGEWIKAKSYAGNQRYYKQFTIDGTGNIVLSTLPTDPVTWTANVIYLARPGPMDDLEPPDTDPEFDMLYVLGVAKQFPNHFHGDERAAVMATMNADYQALMKDFMSHADIEKIDARYRPIIRKPHLRSSVFWGDGEQGP